MTKLVCLTLPYAKYPLERAIEGIARAGYTYIGLGWPHQGEDILGFDPDGPLVHRCLESCSDADLIPIVIGRGPTADTDRAEQLKHRLDVASALGAKCIQMAGVSSHKKFPTGDLDSESFQAAHRAFVADLKIAGAHAEKTGLTLALKPHTGNTATARHLANLLSEINVSAVKACYDPGNVHFYEGIAPEKDFPHIATQTFEIVAKDHAGPLANTNFPIPGEGDIDFSRIFTTAQEAGFNGPVIVERVDGTGGPFTPEEIDTRIAKARQNLTDLLEKTGLETS